MSTQFNKWLQTNGVIHRITNTCVPQEHGLAKRKGGVLQTMMHAMLADGNLPISYWAEALLAACYVSNRLYTVAVDNIPFCLLYKRNPKLNYLRVFGMKAWLYIPLKQRHKWGPKTKKLMFLGYQNNMKAYRFADEDKKLTYSRSASIHENSNWQRIHGYEKPQQIMLPVSKQDKS